MLKGCADLTLAMEDEHYTFLAWYDNSAFAGDAVNPTDYAGEAERLYETVTIKATTKERYTFIGWYTGDNFISDKADYSFEVTQNMTLTARWRQNEYNVSVGKNLSEAGSVSGGGTYPYHSEVTVKAETNITHIFLGWYENGTRLTTSLEYTFTIEMSDRNLEARWKENDVFIFKINGSSCVISGVKDKSATEYIIPDYVTEIGNSAFYGCSSLKSITIPNGVTSIGDSAFFGCSSLTSITIPDGVTSIGASAFCFCSSLTSITIPGGVTSIGYSAFFGCSSLTSITIPDGVTSIGGYAFDGCSGLTSITIPDGVTSIGSFAFRDCSGLTSITIPDGVTSIGDCAFRNCSSLKSITIPDGVTSIGSYAFYGCSRLTSITFEDTSTWYTTTNEADWTNKSGGTVVDVSDSTKNATTFRNSGSNYWYKL